jgi:beta-galactosidase/beta-glucuronidase
VTTDLPAPCRVTMPCRWSDGGLKDFAGRVRFRRHFGYPGRIDENERVWLTFAGIEGAAEIWLNGQFLGRQEQARPFEFDVTKLLGDRNDLRVEVEGEAETGGLWGEVAMEIRLAT